MSRQSSTKSNKRPSRRNSQHDCDSEVSIDESRPSNISSYAEYTESDEELITADVKVEIGSKSDFHPSIDFKEEFKKQSNLIRHRKGHHKSHHRHSIQNPSQAIVKKRQYDHHPKAELLVQMDELFNESEEWRETARWIKYEENLEEGSDRWSRPHIPSLSFQSLLKLRNCLETGVVMMDLEEKNLAGTASKVVEQMVAEDLIHKDDRAAVMKVLMLRHRHVSCYGGFHFGRRKNSQGSIMNIADKTSLNTIETSLSFQNRPNGETKIDIKDEIFNINDTPHDSILRRIPSDSEAAIVLVGTVDFLEQHAIAFVRLAEGHIMPGVIEVLLPIRFLFILIGPRTTDMDFHEIGRSIATLMSNRHFQTIAYKAEQRKELLTAINEFLDDSIVLPAGKWDREHLLSFDEIKSKSDMIRSRKCRTIAEKLKAKKTLSVEEKKLLSSNDERMNSISDDPFRRTGILWNGVLSDIKRRFPMYSSDIKDGLNLETLAATLFLYFAGLATAITFGALIGEKTESLIGTSETLLSSCLVGMIFHALSSQPLVFTGTTGPLILFDASLFQFCTSMSLNFLTIRVYIGIWLGIIVLIISAFEGSVFVRYFTRFTQEIFSALITLIYIVETILTILKNFKDHPLERSRLGNDSDNRNQPNTALFCMLLTLGTFSLAYGLRIFRNSKFLGRNTRRALGDFGVPISILTFVAIDYFVPQVYTPKLSVPDGISPSDPLHRGWLIPIPLDFNWLPIISIVPSMLVFILIFMETEISELIVGKPERGLKKGNGLHWDIVLLCLCNTMCGFFGMPWHCAATVRSVTHVSAVTVMSTNHAPGDSPKIIDIKEQRLSGFFVSLMVGLSIFASPLLKEIPMAVLFGVFLYMGICSMFGVQFFERLRLFFMPVKHHPQVPFVRRVPTWKMHLFTFVQVLALVILWIVKSSPIALGFPFFLLMMVPLRKQLDKIFTVTEIRALDALQPTDDIESEPDFYVQASLPA